MWSRHSIKRRRHGNLAATPTAKTRCDVLGKKHRWQERKERYSPWSTQEVGSYWVCLTCGARSEEKPPE